MVPTFSLIGRTDPCFGWDGTSVVQTVPGGDRTPGQDGPAVEGAFAGVGHAADRAWLARDPLGLGKLFWAGSNGEIELASQPARLVERGHSLDDCAALPANVVVTYRDDDTAPEISAIASRPAGGGGEPAVVPPVDRLAASIRSTVESYVGSLLAARPGPVVVCLSGGLDSTSIAALVRAHRDDVLAVTFDLARPGSTRHSDDLLAAQRAARHLGLTIVPALHDPGRLFELLDTVLVAGIDWRDFNVHAGLVNAGLAVSIAELVGSRRDETTVFTGDLVNELLADYHSETYEGRTYYRLPRLPIAGTRTALVRGLATSHREIGVFGAFGLSVVQPYAAARDAFLQLPDDILGPGPGKGRLYRAMFGDDLPRSSYERPKTRAQTGSEHGERGVLAACADAGFDEHWLARRFARLHGVDDLGALTRFLRAGRYRTAVPLR
jgi:asparagine synthetase B (glutamine-hydrolysing)